MKSLKQQRGFTLVELTLAMAIFSFVLVALSAGVIRLFNIYEAGVASRSTQQSARYVGDLISRDTRAYSTATANATRTAICLYNTEQVDATGEAPGVAYLLTNDAGGLQTTGPVVGGVIQPRQLRRVAIKALPSTCAPAGSAAVITTADVSVLRMDVRPDNSSTSGVVAYDISLAARSALDIVDQATLQCDATKNGLQYCSITDVQLRVGLKDGAL